MEEIKYTILYCVCENFFDSILLRFQFRFCFGKKLRFRFATLLLDLLFCVCMKFPISLFAMNLAILRIFLTPSSEERTCPRCSRVFDTALLCRKHHRRRACKLVRTLLKCADCLQEFTHEEEMKTHRNSCRITTASRQVPCDFIADSTGQCCRRPADFFCRINRNFLKLSPKIYLYSAATKSKTFGAILIMK
jgi:hypothetical protein